MDSTQTTHIAVLPSPGMGHLIPLAEFAKRLVHHHNLSVTFISLAAGSSSKAQKAVLDAFPKSIDSVELPPIPLHDVPSDAKIETVISITVVRSLNLLRDVFKTVVSKHHRISGLVVDLFATDAFDVAREFGVPPYIFFPTTLTTLSLFLNLPTIDAAVSCEYRDLTEPLRLPGCIPFRGKDLLDPVQDRKNDAYKWLLHQCKRYKEAKGILVNSSVAVEPAPAKALMEAGRPPVYPVGPLIQAGSAGGVDKNEYLRWLDKQPRGSVLYVSFGSGGTLSADQLYELALGLEMSGQRFLWVARSPSVKAANETFFSAQSTKDPLDFLPQGFLSRTKHVGLVVPSWAPQIQVLAHESTAGFLTHCGWNSVLESIVHGVPLIGWPLYAEQKMNCVMLTEDIKVALRPKADEEGLIRRGEIAAVVKNLMEGEDGKRVRNRMHELKDSVAKALSEDGSSYNALAQVVNQWKNPKEN